MSSDWKWGSNVELISECKMKHWYSIWLVISLLCDVYPSRNDIFISFLLELLFYKGFGKSLFPVTQLPHKPIKYFSTFLKISWAWNCNLQLQNMSGSEASKSQKGSVLLPVPEIIKKLQFQAQEIFKKVKKYFIGLWGSWVTGNRLFPNPL